MKYKKIIVLAIFLVSLLAISGVSAADNTTSDVVGADATDEVINVIMENPIVGADGIESVASFDNLSNEINAIGDNSVLNLTNDYEYVNGSTDGIVISKAITIDGQGHSIDGKNLSRIFNITSNNVILKNINFINGYTTNEGGAIYWQGNNGEINNCNFDRNLAFEGGAIYLEKSSNYNITSCNFTNNLASVGGGAIYSTESNFSINYCNFDNNSVIYVIFGGTDDHINVTICTTAENYGYSGGFPEDMILCFIKSEYEYKRLYYQFGNKTHLFNELKFGKLNSYIGGDLGDVYQSNKAYLFQFRFLNTTGGEEIIEGIYKGGNSIYGVDSRGVINNTIFTSPNNSMRGLFEYTNVSFNRNNIFNFTGLNIIKTSTILEINDTQFDFGKAMPLSATLRDEYGNPIPNQLVTFILRNPQAGLYGYWFGKISDDDGHISIFDDEFYGNPDLNGLSTGIWSVECTFREDDNYYGYKTFVQLIINKKNTSMFMENISTSINKDTLFIVNLSGLNDFENVSPYIEFNEYAKDLNLTFYVDDHFISSFPILRISDLEWGDDYKNYQGGAWLKPVFNETIILNYTTNISGFHSIHTIFNGNKYFEGSECYATLFVDEVTMDLTVTDTIRNSNTQFVAQVSNLLNETINEGSVIFYDNGYYRGSVSVVNNTATLDYVPTVTGNHTVRAVYTGNSKFQDVEQTATYKVDKVGTKLVVENNTAIVNDNAKIIVKVVADNNETIYSGAVHFYFNDNYMGYAPVYEGLAIIPIEYFSTGFFQYSTNDDVIVDSISLWDQYSANPASQGVDYMMNIKPQVMNYTIGKNIIKAIYSNSNDFADSGIRTNFTVNKAKSDIYMETSFYDDWDCMITVRPVVSDDVYLKGNGIDEGTVRLYVDGKYMGVSSIENGRATVYHRFSRAGNHTIYVEFCESNYFLSSNNATEISLESTDVEISHENINGMVMNDVTFTVNVTNDYAVVNEGFISLYYDNDYISNFPVVNGTAKISFIPQDIHNHLISLKYGGSENFHNNEVEFNIYVSKMPTSVILENVTGTFSFENMFIANVESLNHAINEGVVIFYINDNYIGYDSVVNGSAYLTYTPSTVGNYTVRAIFLNSTYFSDDEYEMEYIVSPLNSTLTLDEVYTTLGQYATIVAHVDSENVVNEGSVTFYHGNDLIGEAQVVNGTAMFTFVPMDYMPDWTSNVVYVSNFTYGNDTIHAIFHGYNYGSSEGASNILVDKAKMNVSVITRPVGFNTTFLVNITKLFGIVDTGNVNFYLSTNYGNYIGYSPIKNGTTSFDYVPLNAGFYNLNVLWSSGIFDAGNLLNFTIKKADSKLNINDLNGTVGHEVILTANVSSPNNLTIDEGYVVFFDGETNIGESNVNNGVVTLTYTPTTAGEHPITAMFYATNYKDNINSALLNVSKASTELSIDNIDDVYFKNPSKFTVHATSNSKKIDEGGIKFYVNDTFIGYSNISNGIATFEYVANGGLSVLTAVYEETANYLTSSQTANFVVNAIPSTLIASGITAYYNDDTNLLIQAVDLNGVPINGAKVLVYLDGVKTFITDNNGQIKVSINGLAPKTYTTKIAFEGNANYTESNAFVDVVIHKAPSYVLVDDLKGVVGYELIITANVANYVNNLTVNDGKVVFFDGETNIGEANVVNGSASLVYTPLNAGTFTVKAVYGNSVNFADCENTASLNVGKADSEILINDVNGTVDYKTSLTVNVVSSNNLTINEGHVVFFDNQTNIGEANVVNGVATLTYAPTTAGNHSITAWFNSDNYQDSISSALLTVAKGNIDLTIGKIDSVYFTNPSKFVVNVNSNSKAVNEGKIEYYVNNRYIGIVDVTKGNSRLTYVTNNTGLFTLTVVYEETENYLVSNTSSYFEVSKMPTTLTGESVIFNEEAYKTFTTELKDDNNNGVNGKPVKIEVIKYSGESATFNGISDSNGITVYDVGKLAGGMWYVTGIYAGDENYIESNFADKFIVVRMTTTTDIEEISNPKVNHTYKLKANIHDENGKLVKEGIVQFYLDGVDIGSIDLSNPNQKNNGVLGTSLFAYKLGDDDSPDLYLEYIPSKAGKHTLTAVYEGTTIYKASNQTTTFVVTEEIEPEITIPPLDAPSDDGSVNVTLPKDATGTVILTVNGQNYTFNVKDGVANVKLPELDNGDYSYTITYSGDSKYSSFTNDGSLKVNNKPVTPVENTTDTNITGNATNPTENVTDNTKITASPTKVTYNAGSYFKITVYGADGKLADGATVTISGKISKTLTTKDGVAKFKVTQKPGTYKITITALGKSVTKTITVKHLVTLKAVTVKKSAKKLVLQATLGKVNGKYLNKKTVTFKFNGKKYTAKTNKKGVAKLTIKNAKSGKNTYNIAKLKVGKKVTYQATYLKDTVKKTVKVKK